MLRGIKDYFSKEIKKIEEIESDFENFLNIINFKTYEQYNLSILSSLENSNSFTNYLKKLSHNIIEKYKNEISKIDKHDFYYEKKLKRTIEALKNHLALELNSEPSQIDDTEFFSKEEIETGIFCNAFTSNELKIKTDKIDEIKKLYLKKVNNIENFIEQNISSKTIDINSYMKEAILEKISMSVVWFS